MTTIEFLKDYFNKDEYFMIAQKYPKIDDKVKHHQSMLNIENKHIIKQLGKFYFLNKNQDVDIYFSLNTYHQQKSFYPSRKEEYVKSIKSFYFDIDKGDVESKKLEIISLLGHPTYIIESSKDKYQFIYKFHDPLIVKDKSTIDYFKKHLKGLIYHFDIDRTFDSARIFRLVRYMNKKVNNNNFVVTIKKFNNYYTFKEFEEIAKQYMLKDEQKKVLKPSKHPQKAQLNKNTNISTRSGNFKEFKGIEKIINRKYKDLLKKYDYDYSTADIAYARWLYFAKYITDDKTIVKKIFEARGYQDLMNKHGYQIDYYFENILEKCKL